MRKPLIIALDGPSGAGKSTVARLVAAKLGILHLDTGAMYRAVGHKALSLSIQPNDEAAVSSMLAATKIEVRFRDGRQQTMVDGVDVSGEIRTPAVSRAASDVSALPAVRRALVAIQRQIAATQPLVLDGRDIGTYVLPDAPYKFFLTAAAEERARRRLLELKDKGAENVDYAAVLAEMKYRDEQDAGREMAPLCRAEDAILVDTTGLGIDEVVAVILEKIDLSDG